MNQPLEILKQYFGYQSFRPLQQEIIDSVLKGTDTLALLPTGGGKSVCYQVPALCMEGMCLVITPLIALMKDQVMQLRKRNISALSIHSGLAYFEVRKNLEQATTGHYKFLFVSPERLQTRLFLEFLPGMPIHLLAVDEAHCISQWGYDFRPSYLRIAELREELPGVPVLALTASATPEVQTDICAKLLMDSPATFTQSFARANLSFSAFDTIQKMNKLLDILQHVPGSGLVYCRNRKRTKDICTWLQQQGISASYYHAGLTSEERHIRQMEWIQSKTRIMVCTNAFGMGIDKPDVRIVVHVSPPESIEDYYQEAGRAGRDGKRAYAVLLYNQAELKDLEASTVLKFPGINIIQKVYQSVANYLQLPVGSGEGMYFDFDINDFFERYALEPVPTINALKTLETEGYLTFNESVFMPSKAGFHCTREYLIEFQREKPQLEEIIKVLLRNYEGIFDHEVNISEKMIARQLKSEPEEVTRLIGQLVQFGVILYTPKKDTPQIFFPYPRISAEQIRIDQKSYEARKQRHLIRVRNMIRYTFEPNCRSNFMQHYFGEKDLHPCGICDDCLARKRKKEMKHQQLLAWLEGAKKILSSASQSSEFIQSALQITRYEMDALTDLALREEYWKLKDDGSFELNKE